MSDAYIVPKEEYANIYIEGVYDIYCARGKEYYIKKCVDEHDSLVAEVERLKQNLAMANNLIKGVIYSTYDFSVMVEGNAEKRWIEDAQNFIQRIEKDGEWND